MAKRKLNTEQIIGVLKQVEAGRTAADVAREAGVSQHTIYAWKAKYGGLEVSEAEELRSLRDENNRLKRLVAPSPRSFAMPQILAPVQATLRAPAAALTGAPVCLPDSKSGAKEQTNELNRNQNVV